MVVVISPFLLHLAPNVRFGLSADVFFNLASGTVLGNPLFFEIFFASAGFFCLVPKFLFELVFCFLFGLA